MSNESVLDLIPGKPCDIYYPDPCSAHKSAFNTTVDTRFVQAMANLGAGSNTFTLPPASGYQDVILQLQMPPVDATNTYVGLALNAGWGYALIRQISYRVGGSSQYFLTGQQVLQACLKNAADSQNKNDILTLGGSAAAGAAAFTALNASGNFAYVWLPLPWTKPSAVGKPTPLPSDLLTQQVQITVEFFPLSSIFSVAGAGGTPSVVPPAQLASAQFQVQQLSLDNKGDELAQRVNMTQNSLSYPCEFIQQEVTIDLNTSAATNKEATLTGFRSGQVKEIDMWLSQNADLPRAYPGATTVNLVNPFYWFAPRAIQMTYAGQVFARFDAGSSQLWNLVNGRFQPQVTYGVVLTGTGATNAFTLSAAANSQWVTMPFAQAMENNTSHTFTVNGKEIRNGIINLQLSTPAATVTNGGAPGSGGNWILHVSYVYNAVAVFGMGTCDFAF